MEDEKVWSQITKMDIDQATSDNIESGQKKTVEQSSESTEGEPEELKPKKAVLAKKKNAPLKKKSKPIAKPVKKSSPKKPTQALAGKKKVVQKKVVPPKKLVQKKKVEAPKKKQEKMDFKAKAKMLEAKKVAITKAQKSVEKVLEIEEPKQKA